MTIKFVGHHSKIRNIPLGFHSMDMALAKRPKDEPIIPGWPVPTLVEIFGPTGIGKTTTALSILSMLSCELGLKQMIADVDLESQDEDMVSDILQFSGYPADEFKWVTAKGSSKAGDEELIQELADTLYEDPPYLGLLDSAAALASRAEKEGDIGDANMGRRAFPLGQFVRRVVAALRVSKDPSTMIILNHQYEAMQTMGGAKVYTAPGGVVKNNLSHLRIRVQRPFVDYISSGESKTKAQWETCWVLEGKVEKNRTGKVDEKFQVVVVGGKGLHKGLSAIIDCLALGYAKVQTGKLVMDGQEFGSLKKIMDRQQDDEELFVPFHNQLKAAQPDVEEEVEDKPKKKSRGKKK